MSSPFQTAPPSEDGSWLPTESFAKVAGISRQAARKALKSALEGRPWRDEALQVRRTISRGGRGGLSYEVRFESLPDTLRPLPGSFAPKPRERPTVREHDQRVIKRWEIIAGSIEYPRGSAERAKAVELAAFGAGISERTVYRWIDQYEEHGIRGLNRARPSNAGEPRIFVSRVFDRHFRAAGHSENLHGEITRAMEKALKGLWASRAEQAGSTEVRRLAEFLLLEDCEKRGIRLPAEAYRLSRRYVERFALYRVVNQRKNDRKAFDDAKPRIRRDWTTLAPMERIVADVKHLDVIVTRPDGSPAWPKIVAFMDAGTGRVLVHPVLLDRGEGVRQEHVIEGFLAMVAQPSWGFPQGLYLDNGAEFGALTKVAHAMQLINDTGARTLIFARPYNASAKPIESLFARLDRYVFSLLPGYAGPNRMAKKTQAVGKPPKPYPGSWEEFCDTLQQLIAAHNHRPVGGLWSGRSPQDWMQEKVDAGWRAVHVDPEALDAAFSDHDSRRIDRGVLKINGQRYSHPSLVGLPSRTVVDLALPWRRGSPPLARVGVTWVYLEREIPYPARWVEGARESSRRQASQAKRVRGLAMDAPKVDPVAAKLRWAERAAEPALKRGHKIDLGGPAADRAQDSRKAEAGAAERRSSAQRRLEREMALTERLERGRQPDE